jgi:hypothetical protein
MERKFKFLGELTEDGLLQHDRDEVRVTLLDLEAAIFQLGGVMTMTAIRTEVAPGEYVSTGVLVSYDSFSPAQRVEEAEDASRA